MTDEPIVFTEEEQKKLNRMYEQWMIADHQKKLAIFEELNQVFTPNGVVFAGDSITEAYPIHELIKLDKPLYNRGISGITSLQLLDHLEDHVLALKPSIVIILIGTNDIERNIPPMTTALAIKSACERIMDSLKNVKLVVQSVYPINESIPFQSTIGKRTNLQIDSLNMLVQEQLHCVPQVRFIDMKPLLEKANQLNSEYTYDGLHLTTQGYFKVTQTLMSYLTSEEYK